MKHVHELNKIMTLASAAAVLESLYRGQDPSLWLLSFSLTVVAVIVYDWNLR